MRATLIGLAGVGLATGVAVSVLRRRLLIVTVTGDSMRPAVASGDWVLVRRARFSDLRSGDVVVVEQPPGSGRWEQPPPRRTVGARNWMIKRIAALPGEPCPDPPALARAVPSRLSEYAGNAVPAGMLVVLGDNRGSSFDPRVFGYYPAERVLGVVIRPFRTRAPPRPHA